MSQIFESLFFPLLLLLASALAVSLSWRARGMTFHLLWARWPLQQSEPSLESSLSPTSPGPADRPCQNHSAPFVSGQKGIGEKAIVAPLLPLT
jgi:hypothetical protein